MVAAAMSLELHDCGIHAAWSGAGEADVTKVRFPMPAAANGKAREPDIPMIEGSFGSYAAKTARDHESATSRGLWSEVLGLA